MASKLNEKQVEMSAEEDLQKEEVPNSPHWGWALKLIVAILLIVSLIGLIVRFNNYFKLVLIAFVLSFLLYPLASFLRRRLHLNWRLATALVYLVVFGLIGWGLASGGTTIFEQAQNLIQTLQNNIGAFTSFLESWSNRVIQIGPLSFSTPELNVDVITAFITERLQPILSQAGSLAGKVVGRVGSFLFNFFITIMVSFFLTSESEGARKRMFDVNLPGYEYDIKRIGSEVSKIFNAFIRGEFTVVGAAILIYAVLLGAFGLPYFILLAVVAGLGRFIPYVGAWIGWIGFFVGALFQQPTPFGLSPFFYALLIFGITLVIDTLLDNILMPKVMGNSLEVHPAAIMISALVGAQLLGLLGVILAAPVFATTKLITRYSVRKLLDQDPWEGISYYKKPKEPRLLRGLRQIFARIQPWLEKPLKNIAAWFRRVWQKTKPKAEAIKKAAQKQRKAKRTD